MPAVRLSMRKIREVLRLRYAQGLSIRQVATSVSASPSTISDCLGRAQLAGLSWPLAEGQDDAALAALLYPRPAPPGEQRVPPDLPYLHRELRRRKDMTLMLLWQEYKQTYGAAGYQYTQFCAQYRRFKQSLGVTMRQDHRAGDKTFVDFSGDGIEIVNPETGEVREAPLFVAVLGASSYTYAEACAAQDLRCWLDAHIHAFEYFGGVSAALVPDNTKDAVTKPGRYEPDLNPSYLDLARHYGTAVLPARPRKPRDKAKVENAVLLAQRWILAALRNHTFFSLAEANQAIREKLAELNNRQFQKLNTTRRELYEQVDKPALRPLPPTRYEFAAWATATVNIDYHVAVDGHYYSVPYQLAHKSVEVRRTARTVEVFLAGRRVAAHPRSYRPGRHTTLAEHMPEAHRRHLEWTPSRIIAWAQKTGPATAQLAEHILASRPHPEQGYRSCLGLFRLGKTFGAARLEAACRRALDIGASSYKSVQSILKSGLDRAPLPAAPSEQQTGPPVHDNLRGPDYYH